MSSLGGNGQDEARAASCQSLDQRAFRYRLARFLLTTLSRFCSLDSECLHQRILKKYRAQQERETRTKAHQSEWSKVTHWSYHCAEHAIHLATSLLLCVRENLWPSLVLLVYFYTTVKFSLSAYHLTLRHSYLMKLIETKSAHMENASNEGLPPDVSDTWHLLVNKFNATQQEELLRQELASLEDNLRHLGSPYDRIGPIAAIGYLLLIELTVMTYIFPQIYYNYVTPMGFFMKDLLKNEPTERAHCSALVRYELQRFRNSTDNNIECIRRGVSTLDADKFIVHSDTDVLQLPESIGRVLLGRDRGSLLLVHMALERQASLWRRLEQLNCDGEFAPINRSPEWVDKLLGNFNSFIIGNSIYSLIFDVTIALGLPYLAGIQLNLDIADVQSLVEMFVLAEINVFSTCFCAALLVSHCTDQTEYSAKLADECCACVRSNRRIYEQLMARCSHETPAEAKEVLGRVIEKSSEDLSVNMIHFLLKYRIFIAQMRPVQKSWDFIILPCLNLIIVCPILMRLFAPYLVSNIRLLGIACSLTFVGYTDILVLPICKFHLQGHQLYKRLWSLLAHTIEVDAHSNCELKRSLYNEAAVAMLRKELSHPDKVIDQFLTRSIGLQVTFPEMVKIHFYYGILMISLYSELQSWRVLFGERLNDPLGLMRKD